MSLNQKNNITQILECVKNEHINTDSIDFKTKYLINTTSLYNHTYHKFSLSIAALLLTLVSILGTLNYYKYQQQIARQIIQQERDNAFNTDYIYTTLVDSYKNK